MTQQDEIVEEIVTNLRPFKRDEKFAVDETKRCIEILREISRSDGKKLRPSDAQKKRLKFRKALVDLVEAFEQLPRGAIDTYMFFAQTPKRRLAYAEECRANLPVNGPNDSKIRLPTMEARDAGAELLQQLKQLAIATTNIAGRKKSQDGILPDVPFKTPVAGYARLLILETSKKPITGTAEGAYRTISSLLYKAVRGREIDFKRWCDFEIKRQSEHERILRSLEPAGTRLSDS